MRKALMIGIDDYQDERFNLSGCISDVLSMSKLLEFNDNGERNFSILKLVDSCATKSKIKKSIEKVFDEETDVGLFYFSGHGFDDETDGKIVTYDYSTCDYGLSFDELIKLISSQKARNKIIILDCCYSGRAGNNNAIGDMAVIPEGVTILTSCKSKQTSQEINGHGLFTNLLIDAISGGAADIMGFVTPGSIYAYIDRALGAFEQRPVFKTNVSRFVSIRNCEAVFTSKEIRKLKDLFPSIDYKFQLNPSFEPTNYKGSKEGPSKEPYRNEDNVKIFDFLQKLNRNRLLIPSNQKHMYYAAMEFDTCELTPLGKHYLYLIKKGII